MLRIMLVDDEENITRALRRSLISFKAEITEKIQRNNIEIFTSPSLAIARAGEGLMFDIIISDYRMPEMNGVAFFKVIREIQPNSVRFLLSGYADLDGLIGAINEAKIHRFIAKPWDEYCLHADINQALKVRDLQMENQRLADEVRQQRGVISLQELELLRLEAEMPGITKVRRTPDGGVILFEE